MSPEAAEPTRTARRIDLAATVLLAAATLATAWAGYQSSRWHSEQAKAQAKATATRIQGAQSEGDANREGQVDVSLFFQWVDARAQGDAELAGFYRNRFTDRFVPAFDAWIATHPFSDPNAPSSPFVLKQYSLEPANQAASLEAQASAAGAEAMEDIDRADRYVLAVVLFAACLFLAGLSTRLQSARSQQVILGLGWLLFACTAIWVVTFPVTVQL